MFEEPPIQCADGELRKAHGDGPAEVVDVCQMLESIWRLISFAKNLCRLIVRKTKAPVQCLRMSVGIEGLVEAKLSVVVQALTDVENNKAVGGADLELEESEQDIDAG